MIVMCHFPLLITAAAPVEIGTDSYTVQLGINIYKDCCMNIDTNLRESHYLGICLF